MTVAEAQIEKAFAHFQRGELALAENLPPAIADSQNRQGWIKFGKPTFLSVPTPWRMVQPQAGQLILFPSFLWHGPVPFHDSHSRTTVTFDVVQAR